MSHRLHGSEADGDHDDLFEPLRHAFGPGATIPAERVVKAIEESSGLTRILLREPFGKEQVDLGTVGPMEDELGARYQVFGEIARGGVGVVLRGRDKVLGREVAIKVLRDRHRGNPSMLNRFFEEAQVGGQLQHPGIVAVHEVGFLARNRPFFTMKLVQGQTLAELLGDRADPSEDRQRLLGVFEKVCQTVAYAHSRGVIHRDLKPANIMVGRFGEVQVMDWGMAKVLRRGGVADEERALRSTTGGEAVETVRSGESHSQSLVGSVFGTPQYMPPEQARGNVDQLTERSDVFSLGCILCEILTGAPPYCGDKEEALTQAVECRTATCLQRMEECGADPALVELANRALARDPQQRPRNGDEVVERMGAFLSSVEERARAAELARVEAETRSVEERRARKLQAALSAAVLAGIIAVSGGWYWLSEEAVQRRDEASSNVVRVLEQARLLHGNARAAPVGDLVPWNEALVAAGTLEGLLESDDVSAGTSVRAREFVSELYSEYEAAGASAENEARDREMISRLEWIRIPADDNPLRTPEDLRATAEKKSEDYALTFAEYGLDVVAAGEESLENVLAAHSVGLELAVALDDWAAACAVQGDEAAVALRSRILRLARVADPDPRRTRLRELMVADDRSPEAIALLLDDVEMSDLPPATLGVVAEALRGLGERDRAVEFYQGAHRLHPDDFAININLGRALTATSRHAAALPFYTAAVALRPNSIWARMSLAVARENVGDVEGAIRGVRDLIGMRPDDPLLYGYLGRLLSDSGDRKAALEVYREAVRLHRSRAYLESVGNTLDQLGRDGEAVEALEQALELAMSASTLSSLVRILLRRGETDRAMEHVQNAIAKLGSDNAQVRTQQARVLEARGDLDGAIELIEESVKSSVESGRKTGLIPSYSELGKLYASRGDFRTAIESFQRALQLKEDPRVRIELARALIDSGRLAEGVDMLRTVIALVEEDPDIVGVSAERPFGPGQVSPERVARQTLGVGAEYFVDFQGYFLFLAYRGLSVGLKRGGDWSGSHQANRSAISYLVPRMAAHPDGISPYSELHHELGADLFETEDVVGAADAFAEVVRVRPDLWKTHEWLAGSLGRQARYRESLEILERIAEAVDAETATQMGLAESLEPARRNAQAEPRLAAIVGGRSPEGAAETWHAAFAAYWKGDFARSVALYRDATEKYSEWTKNAPVHWVTTAPRAVSRLVERGVEHGEPLGLEEVERLGDLANSFLEQLLHFERTCLFKDILRAHVVAGRVQFHLQDPALSAVREAEALARMPTAVMRQLAGTWSELDALYGTAASFAEGSALLTGGEWSRAEEVLRRLIAAHPDEPPLAQSWLVKSLARQERWEEALRFAEQAASYPWHLRGASLVHVAQCHSVLGNSEKAFKALMQAAEMGMRDVDFAPFVGEFNSLHEDPRWAELMTRIDANSR